MSSGLVYTPTTDATAGATRFHARSVSGLPPAAAAFLRHAIRDDTAVPDRIHLRMHGHIKLGGLVAFTAEQSIDVARRFRWQASIAGGLIRGHDSYDDGRGETRFHLAGGLPLINGSGPHVARSAAGRLLGEYCAWMPWALLPTAGTHWHDAAADHAIGHVPVDGTFMRVDIGIEPAGSVRDITYLRWGHPGRGPYRWVAFGMRPEAERTFDGLTIVSAGRVGWWYGTSRWRRGEFFRFTIDDLRPCSWE